jgi:hypothetical protein
MARPRVTLDVPPHLADIEMWGRDVGGEWWALIVWHTQVIPPDVGRPVAISCAAWAPGRHVELPLQAVDYLEVRRLQLGAEPAEWPGPVNRPGAVWGGYYLGLLDGNEPQLPAEAGQLWGHELGSAYDD